MCILMLDRLHTSYVYLLNILNILELQKWKETQKKDSYFSQEIFIEKKTKKKVKLSSPKVFPWRQNWRRRTIFVCEEKLLQYFETLNQLLKKKLCMKTNKNPKNIKINIFLFKICASKAQKLWTKNILKLMFF